MSSFLRRLRSTTRLHSPRSEPPPPSTRVDSHPSTSSDIAASRASSPTKLRAGPARRGYEALEGDQLGASDGGFLDLGTSSAIDSWTLDEGDETGELGEWVWVDVDLAGAAATERGERALGRGRAASLPHLDLAPAPPLVPFSPSFALSPGRDPPTTPTKRKASISSPDLSPTTSFSSALLSPSSPASRTSTSSLAPPPTPSSPTSSTVSLSFTIATRIDHNGRRVLTSRRRLSLKPSPCETRRHKDLYGIGDDASGDEQDEDVEFAPAGAGLELVDVGATIRGPRTGLGMLDLELFAAHGRSASSPPTLSHTFEARPTRARPTALEPLAIPSSAPARHCESPLPSPTLARLPEHQPIKTFWPPPPLDPPSSPTKASPFSSLTRSNTTYSSRTSSSSSATGSSSAAKRHNSLLQPRRTFRRLSLSSRHGSGHGGAGSGAAPLMCATTFSSLHERRASAPALEPLAGVDLERHTSMSSFGSASGSGAFSIPPTPGATSSSSHYSLGTGASCSTSEPLLALARQQSLSSGGGGPSAHARRASQVSFELPPSTPSEARRSAAAAMTVASENGHAGASFGPPPGSHPPLSPSSSFARSRRHARSTSEGGTALQMSVLERAWVPLEDQAERELARGTLIVVNPDTTSASPSRPSSSPIDTTSTAPSSCPSASPSFSRTTCPSRPPKSLARWSAPPSQSPFLTSPQPPTPPAASRGIGVAC
ncbi:hypothetical protein JCM3775_000567 [Rhodotorula graminis]|uniref:Proteophosphoglycan ppg4 n=1 Tax=Rhodotorula graminis (strain WP1) TaxID=578459 RepID=A0A0P9ENW7_RHOGW|nr:uncharacterized protein RHOBADRAFT_54422 [Rhodotorula graminis WP1]KPV73826.1 hypothetical protein RHOBADRAFT_54422 [Rhodotorula graminis WP1]